jgi:thioester reductase-like protein
VSAARPGGRVVLLTGATGFVGKVVLEQLLRRSAELGVARVLLVIRAGDREQAQARLRSELVRSGCFGGLAPGWETRVEALAGDLARPQLGLDAEARERVVAQATHVVHCAASIEFDLPLADATAVNATGALHALELARACRRLESYVGVSTAYVSPHPRPRAGALHRAGEALAPLPGDPSALYAAILAGGVDEARLLAETRHPNTYTLTKCLAEHLVAARALDLPVTLVRPSIVSASREQPLPGWIDSAAAFAGFVAMIGTGRLRVVAGDRRARIDVVPCDEVARRIVSAAFSPAPAGRLRIRHAVAGFQGSLPIPLCRERIVAWFARHPLGREARLDFVGRRGPFFHAAHALRHELPGLGASLWLALRQRADERQAVRRLLERQRAANRDFAYFTHASFAFETSQPLEPPLDPERYVDLVCEGVSRHLLRRGRRLPRPHAGTQPPSATPPAPR